MTYPMAIQRQTARSRLRIPFVQGREPLYVNTEANKRFDGTRQVIQVQISDARMPRTNMNGTVSIIIIPL